MAFRNNGLVLRTPVVLCDLSSEIGQNSRDNHASGLGPDAHRDRQTQNDVECGHQQQQETARGQMFRPAFEKGDTPKLVQDGKHGNFWNFVGEIVAQKCGITDNCRTEYGVFLLSCLEAAARSQTCQNATPFMPNQVESPR